MREAELERKAALFAKGAGWLTYKFTSTSQRGVPDRLFFRNSILLIVEFKARGKKPTKLQENIHSKLRAQGFEVHIIDDIDEARKLLT